MEIWVGSRHQSRSVECGCRQPASRRGKTRFRHSRRHTFTFLASCSGVAARRASSAFLPSSQIAPLEGHVAIPHPTDLQASDYSRHCDEMLRRVAMQPAGPAAPAPTPHHCVAGNRVERGFRGEFAPHVLVVSRHAGVLSRVTDAASSHPLLAATLNTRRAAADFRRAAPAPSATGRLRGDSRDGKGNS